MTKMENPESSASLGDYVIRVLATPLEIDAATWNALLNQQSRPTPFMRHEYLAALHRSGCASDSTGWTPRLFTLHDSAGQLAAACPLYVKTHSRGEYVFDWSWADAHHRHGIAYYPKAVIAVPFTPAPGSRLLARDAAARHALLNAVLAWCRAQAMSSLHLLFSDAEDLAAARKAGLMVRHTVQFHWRNRVPARYQDFDDFLSDLTQEKRKKIRQERRKVQTAGVTVRALHGPEISASDWEFFYRCYERTYMEHGNPPYLNRSFFKDVATRLPDNWLMFLAERQGAPIASSLLAVDDNGMHSTMWGRYWGAMERVDCLHFELCYYSPLEWCIEHGCQQFEGGAQGEHKLARALLPVQTDSAHWLLQPDFAQAVDHFLQRERQGITDYLDNLDARSPLRRAD